MAEQLVIVKLSSGWSIFVRGEWWGRFDAQIDAVSAALRFIDELNNMGADASLIVQDRYGELRACAETSMRQTAIHPEVRTTRDATLN